MRTRETSIYVRSDIVKEEWKKIDGYNGVYSVSNYGKVVNNKTGNEMEVKYNYKFPVVMLSKCGIVTKHPVCLLVARAFMDNPDNDYFVRFIDGNKRNSCVNNLEWTYAADY